MEKGMCHQYVYVNFCMIYFFMANVMGFSETYKFVGEKILSNGQNTVVVANF